MNLFTYGSLMFEAVWQQVVTGHYGQQPASLSGFVRRCVKNESYPVIFRGGSDDCIDGVLYMDITPGDLALLDAFEGEYYAREPVTALLPDGISADAEAYVLKKSFHHIASDREWDSNHFATTAIHPFMERHGF